MRPEEARRLFRVGLGLAVSLAMLVLVIGLLGRASGIFASRVTLHTSFSDINGLVVGAVVRLAGVDIGTVDAIRFDGDPRNKAVHVALRVQRRYLDRIRADSVARLASKGLLGDLIVNVSLGSPEAPPLRNGDRLRSAEGADLAEMARSLKEALAGVQKLAAGLDERLRLVLTPQAAQDLGRAVHATANLLEKVEKGDGLLHALIYRADMTRDAAGLLASGRAGADRLAAAAGRLDRALLSLERGPGALHELLYGEKGRRLLDELLAAVGEIDDVVGEVRRGRGLLHAAVYDEDAGQLVKDLAETARLLRGLAQETQQGKGTIGGLLKDPTVYEDLKMALGRVTRNRLLRAVLRYVIKEDGLSAPAGR